MRGAIPVRRLQFVAHVAAFGQRQSWLGDCWAGYVAADAIQLFALVRLSRYGGVQAKAIDFADLPETVVFSLFALLPT